MFKVNTCYLRTLYTINRLQCNTPIDLPFSFEYSIKPAFAWVALVKALSNRHLSSIASASYISLPFFNNKYSPINKDTVYLNILNNSIYTYKYCTAASIHLPNIVDQLFYQTSFCFHLHKHMEFSVRSSNSGSQTIHSLLPDFNLKKIKESFLKFLSNLTEVCDRHTHEVYLLSLMAELVQYENPVKCFFSSTECDTRFKCKSGQLSQFITFIMEFTSTNRTDTPFHAWYTMARDVLLCTSTQLANLNKNMLQLQSRISDNLINFNICYRLYIRKKHPSSYRLVVKYSMAGIKCTKFFKVKKGYYSTVYRLFNVLPQVVSTVNTRTVTSQYVYLGSISRGIECIAFNIKNMRSTLRTTIEHSAIHSSVEDNKLLYISVGTHDAYIGNPLVRACIVKPTTRAIDKGNIAVKERVGNSYFLQLFEFLFYSYYQYTSLLTTYLQSHVAQCPLSDIALCQLLFASVRLLGLSVVNLPLRVDLNRDRLLYEVPPHSALTSVNAKLGHFFNNTFKFNRLQRKVFSGKLMDNFCFITDRAKTGRLFGVKVCPNFNFIKTKRKMKFRNFNTNMNQKYHSINSSVSIHSQRCNEYILMVCSHRDIGVIINNILENNKLLREELSMHLDQIWTSKDGIILVPSHLLTYTSAQSIDTSAQSIDTSAQSIDTSAQSIDTSAQSIDTSAQSIDTSAQSIDTSAQSIDTSAQSIDTSAQSIDTSAQSIDTSAQSIDTSAQSIDTSAQSIDTSAQSSRGFSLGFFHPRTTKLRPQLGVVSVQGGIVVLPPNKCDQAMFLFGDNRLVGVNYRGRQITLNTLTLENGLVSICS